jgi:hypothetical protein
MITQNNYVALSYMSEIFELPEEVEEVKDLEEPKEKMVRKKKEMSAERKAVIRAVKERQGDCKKEQTEESVGKQDNEAERTGKDRRRDKTGNHNGKQY